MMSLTQISHFIQIWIFPPGLIVLLLLMSFIIRIYSLRTAKLLAIFAFLSLWILSAPLFVQKFIDSLQNQYLPLSLNQTIDSHPHAAILVLGSGAEDAPEYSNKSKPSDQSLSRLHYAIYLHKKLHLPIIVSGGNKNNTAHTEAELMGNELNTNYQIPILAMETKSINTQDESQRIVSILKQCNIDTVYLVTHAMHMPRSMYIFKHSFARHGLTIIPAPMGYITIQSAERFSNYLPLLNGLTASVFAMHEYVGMIAAFFYGVFQ